MSEGNWRANALRQIAEYKALYERAAAENRWLQQQSRESVEVAAALIDELLEARRRLAGSGQPAAAPRITRHGDVPYIDLPADWSVALQTPDGLRTVAHEDGELHTDLPTWPTDFPTFEG
jgi:hypothetical protein